MKLHELPRESKLIVWEEGAIGMQQATFHHTDGMYSLCTMDRDKTKIFHLHVLQEMIKVNNHYEIFNHMDSIKAVCVGIKCKNKLPKTPEYFNRCGNFCIPCDRQMNKDIKEGRGWRKKLVKMGIINDNII